MEKIIKTEEVFNSYGDLIAIRYHYADGVTREIKKFTPRHMLKEK